MAGAGRIVALLLSISTSASAEVYRCESQGKVTYTDRPCAAGAPPQALPAPTVVPRGQDERERAREYDRRIERERQARDRADAEWAEAHRARKERDEALRHARIAGKVVKGMDAGDVRSAWGEPAEITREERDGVVWERWTYRDGGAVRTVQFRGGEVHSTRRQGGK
ncbi:MAG: DUF4124 domain-containing protein [Gammaproteobacteria bacterium]|nr:DUF4124 domain-containing protein [Gammaproteobacteria bacterium]